MKLVKIANKKSMLAFDFGDGNGKTWTNTSKKVYEFVKNNIPEGTEVSVKFGDTNQDGMKYVVLVKKGNVDLNSNSSSQSKSTSTSSGSSNKIGNDIMRENASKATANALIALQGQIDLNNIFELIDRLHAKFMEKNLGN